MDPRSDDRSALMELKATYFRLLDTKRWDEWRQLFTDGFVFHGDESAGPLTDQPMASGGDAFVELVSAALQNAVTVHQGHMPELTFVDDRNANGIWAMFDWVDSSASGGFSMQGFGHYHERYVKGDDGRWRFEELTLRRLRVDQMAASSVVPPPVAPWTRSRASS